MQVNNNKLKQNNAHAQSHAQSSQQVWRIVWKCLCKCPHQGPHLGAHWGERNWQDEDNPTLLIWISLCASAEQWRSRPWVSQSPTPRVPAAPRTVPKSGRYRTAIQLTLKKRALKKRPTPRVVEDVRSSLPPPSALRLRFKRQSPRRRNQIRRRERRMKNVERTWTSKSKTKTWRSRRTWRIWRIWRIWRRPAHQ